MHSKSFVMLEAPPLASSFAGPSSGCIGFDGEHRSDHERISRRLDLALD
jgi:hypothetical protein